MLLTNLEERNLLLHSKKFVLRKEDINEIKKTVFSFVFNSLFCKENINTVRYRFRSYRKDYMIFLFRKGNSYYAQ